MTGDDESVSVRVFLYCAPDEDDADLEASVLAIRREWAEIGTLLPAPTVTAPPDTRAVDPVLLGAIAAAISPDGLIGAVEAVRRWVGHRTRRKVAVVRADGSSLTLSDATEDQQSALVADWLAG